jgi:hypothetical protein
MRWETRGVPIHFVVADVASTGTVCGVRRGEHEVNYHAAILAALDGVALLPTFFETQGASNDGKVRVLGPGSLTHLVLCVQVEVLVCFFDPLYDLGRAQVGHLGLGVTHVLRTLYAAVHREECVRGER